MDKDAVLLTPIRLNTLREMKEDLETMDFAENSENEVMNDDSLSQNNQSGSSCLDEENCEETKNEGLRDDNSSEDFTPNEIHYGAVIENLLPDKTNWQRILARKHPQPESIPLYWHTEKNFPQSDDIGAIKYIPPRKGQAIPWLASDFKSMNKLQDKFKFQANEWDRRNGGGGTRQNIVAGRPDITVSRNSQPRDVRVFMRNIIPDEFVTGNMYHSF